MLLLKKPLGDASKQLTTQVLIMVALVGVAILGEVSVNVIEPLKVTSIPGQAPWMSHEEHIHMDKTI